MFILRDGRHLVGVLRSFDQYMNLVLADTCERVLLPGSFSDIPLGLHIVRGDNVVLMGQIDASKEETTPNFKRLSPENVGDTENEAQKASWEFD